VLDEADTALGCKRGHNKGGITERTGVRLRDFAPPMADVGDDGPTGSVQDLSAIGRDQVHALCALNDDRQCAGLGDEGVQVSAAPVHARMLRTERDGLSSASRGMLNRRGWSHRRANGKKIRTACLVRNTHLGWIIRFIELMPKKQAFEQAIKIWEGRE
jgi:hypothetical protein